MCTTSMLEGGILPYTYEVFIPIRAGQIQLDEDASSALVDTFLQQTNAVK